MPETTELRDYRPARAAAGTRAMKAALVGIGDLEPHRRELTGYCQRMVGASEADDAVQETMLRAWRASAGFDGRSSVRAWLYRIAANTCLDLLRGRERRGRLGRRLQASAEVSAVPASSADPAELAATQDGVRLALAAMLSQLPTRQRAALILCEILRWRSDEAAQILGTSTAAVTSSLQRARATLARQPGHRNPGNIDADQLARYQDAFRRYDIAALVRIIRVEAGQAMPGSLLGVFVAALSLPLQVAHRVNDEDVQAQVLPPAGIEVKPLDPDQELPSGRIPLLRGEVVRRVAGVGTGLALSAIIIAGTAAALFLPRRPYDDNDAGGRLGPPVLSLAAVIMVIYLNQVLFTVYVIRVRHGDPSFIARYLPAGWFALARGHAMEALARQFPDPGLLAPAVLRVQAFLELPLVMFAYLTVSRWFSAGAYREARRLLWPASAAWTATFCLIEWSLHNPYTTDDIVIRIVAAIVVPLWAGRLAWPPPDRVPGLPALLVFAVSTAALGLVVLTVYDTALLYNLGHLGARLPVTAAALVVLAAARVAATLLPRRPPGPGVESITRSFGAFLPLFFVPALPVRYGLIGWGTTYVAAAAALVLVTAAAVRGIADTFARSPVSRVRWLVQMAITVAAGLAAGAAASRLLRDGYPESRLLWTAAAFFIAATITCALIDPNPRPRPLPGESAAARPAAAVPPLDQPPP